MAVKADVEGRRAARSRAQAWFAEPDSRRTSTVFDDRETAGSRVLALEVALALLGRDPDLVIDLGCGGGLLLAAAAQRLPRSVLIGIDPVAAAVDAARALLAGRDDLARVKVVQAGAEDLPLPGSQPADLLLAHLDLALWEDPLAGLVGAVRSLAPGGLFYAVDLVRPSPEEDVKPFLAAAVSDREREYLADQLEASLDVAEAGVLVDAAVTAAGLPCRTVVARGGLAGASLGSAEAARLWRTPGVRAAINALGPLVDVEQAKAQQVLHIQIWREQ